jgi:hypothetical protein
MSDYRKLDVWVKAHAMAKLANEVALESDRPTTNR